MDEFVSRDLGCALMHPFGWLTCAVAASLKCYTPDATLMIRVLTETEFGRVTLDQIERRFGDVNVEREGWTSPLHVGFTRVHDSLGRLRCAFTRYEANDCVYELSYSGNPLFSDAHSRLLETALSSFRFLGSPGYLHDDVVNHVAACEFPKTNEIVNYKNHGYAVRQEVLESRGISVDSQVICPDIIVRAVTGQVLKIGEVFTERVPTIGTVYGWLLASRLCDDFSLYVPADTSIPVDDLKQLSGGAQVSVYRNTADGVQIDR